MEKKDVVELNIQRAHPRYIHTCVIDKNSSIVSFCTFVYGYLNHDGNGNLWNELTEPNVGDHNWCLTGDFNEIRNVKEKNGSNWINISSTRMFNIFIDRNELVDLPMLALDMTWVKGKIGNEAVMEKLDRCLVNYNWLNRFSHCKLTNMGFMYSDHAPLLICHEYIPMQVYKPFRFEAFWLNYPSLQEVV